MTPAEAALIDAQVNGTISATVRALLAGQGHALAALAGVLGVTAETLRRRLNGTSPDWSAGQIAATALFFRVTVEDLYDGLDGRFPGPQGILPRATVPA